MGVRAGSALTESIKATCTVSKGSTITCVDADSQWQLQASVQGISEAYLLPVLEMVIAQFPFQIEGFPSDNGSEYINHKAAKMIPQQQRQRPGGEQECQRRQKAYGLQPGRRLTPRPPPVRCALWLANRVTVNSTPLAQMAINVYDTH